MLAESDSDDVLKVREQAIYKLGALYSREGYVPRMLRRAHEMARMRRQCEHVATWQTCL